MLGTIGAAATALSIVSPASGSQPRRAADGIRAYVSASIRLPRTRSLRGPRPRSIRLISGAVATIRMAMGRASSRPITVASRPRASSQTGMNGMAMPISVKTTA